MSDRIPPGGAEESQHPEDAAGTPAEGLDLFAEDAFQDYDEQPLIPMPPRRQEESEATSQYVAPAAAPSPRPMDGGASPFGAPLLPRRQRPADEGGAGAGGHGASWARVLLWVAIGLVAVLALIALFLLGQRLSEPEPAAAPTPSESETPEPEPEPEPEPTGPAALGVNEWTALRGGECLDPYENPWAEEFTVVDCATPHAAQVLARAPFPGVDEATPFPTAAALQAQINVLCSAPSVIDLAVAGAYADIQIDGSYAVTAEQWAEGLRDYSCFVSRASGEPITGSLAVAG